MHSTEVTAEVTFIFTEGARFNEAMSQPSKKHVVPKGIYRFRSNEAANQHAEDCPARGIGAKDARTRGAIGPLSVSDHTDPSAAKQSFVA
jgi:hypothetical protein